MSVSPPLSVTVLGSTGTIGTQALDVVFCLAGETLILAAPLPGPLGAAGIALAVGGLVLYVCRQV